MYSVKNDIKTIIKFVSVVYKPTKVEVKEVEIEDLKEYIIIFYFDEIDDKYITNPGHGNLKVHKQDMLSRQIRTDVEDYLSIKTTGLQPRNKFYSPIEKHDITILSVLSNSLLGRQR
jgi:hypothetical protein